jgi:hypothetical protein
MRVAHQQEVFGAELDDVEYQRQVRPGGVAVSWARGRPVHVRFTWLVAGAATRPPQGCIVVSDGTVFCSKWNNMNGLGSAERRKNLTLPKLTVFLEDVHAGKFPHTEHGHSLNAGAEEPPKALARGRTS